MNSVCPEPAVAVPVDLTNCDQEPIHIPSLIQPHGVLVAARLTDLQVVYVSENCSEMLGVSPTFLFGLTLPEIFGPGPVESMQKTRGGEQYFLHNIETFTFPICAGVSFDVMTHRTGGLLCIELEFASESRTWESLYSRMEKFIWEVQRPETLADLCMAIPTLMRQLTAYDRVMVYRFDRDGHGEVIAEEKETGMEPFLGLHYPATDIPRQARELYIRQRIRMIGDTGYHPVRVLGQSGLTQGEPLDMTFCGLRSVSPIHIEYLQNMGVGGTFAVSLIHENRLWGMIICHHRTPKWLSLEMRGVCDILGQLISLFVGLKLKTLDLADRLQKKRSLESLSAALDFLNSEATLAAGQNLFSLVAADGACIRLGGHLQLIGATPEMDDADALMDAFDAEIADSSLASDEVSQRFPAFAHLAPVASGALLIRFREPRDGILWLRGEMARTVRWAGKPDASKVQTDDGLRLSPRKSFAAWEEVQRGRSLPWSLNEIEAAVDLECVVAKMLLHRLESQVTESQAVAKALSIVNTQLNAVMDSTSSCILQIDFDWVVLYGNRKAVESRVGFEIGKDFWSGFPAISSPVAEVKLRTAMRERAETAYQTHSTVQDQWYEVRAFPTPDGLSIFFSDISASKKLQEQLTVEQILRERRIEALSHMAGGLAHEISNPLAIIHATASDLLDLCGSESFSAAEVRTPCETILKTADRATKILRGLRGFAREGQKDPLEMASVPGIIQQCMDLQEARFKRHHLRMQLEIEPDMPFVWCREIQIMQIVTNLLNNAFDAVVQSHAAGGWVTLTAKLSGGDTWIEVGDSGPGIADHFKAHLMEPFFTTKEHGLGMGVGLSLSRAIAQDHGGSLTLCEGTPHTLFRLILPKAAQ